MQGICNVAPFPFEWVSKLLRSSVAVFATLLVLATAIVVVTVLIAVLVALKEEQQQFRPCCAANKLSRLFQEAPKLRVCNIKELRSLSAERLKLW